MDETLLDTISGLRALPLAWLRLEAEATTPTAGVVPIGRLTASQKCPPLAT